jgi:hypothetical protein
MHNNHDEKIDFINMMNNRRRLEAFPTSGCIVTKEASEVHNKITEMIGFLKTDTSSRPEEVFIQMYRSYSNKLLEIINKPRVYVDSCKELAHELTLFTCVKNVLGNNADTVILVYKEFEYTLSDISNYHPQDMPTLFSTSNPEFFYQHSYRSHDPYWLYSLYRELFLSSVPIVAVEKLVVSLCSGKLNEYDRKLVRSTLREITKTRRHD